MLVLQNFCKNFASPLLKIVQPAAVGKLISVPEETKKPRRVYAHRGMEGIRKATLRRLLQKGGSLRVAKVPFVLQNR